MIKVKTLAEEMLQRMKIVYPLKSGKRHKEWVYDLFVRLQIPCSILFLRDFEGITLHFRDSSSLSMMDAIRRRNELNDRIVSGFAPMLHEQGFGDVFVSALTLDWQIINIKPNKTDNFEITIHAPLFCASSDD